MPRKAVLRFSDIPMSVEVGTRLGSLEITALLGKGGMGEVYRARDTKLKRDVAIKILPEEFSRNADRVSRFLGEAEVLASLNHPNIGAIYDLEELNGTRFLVLELVEGETLADRIARGSIPVDETLHIAKQIAEALEAAHELGVVHRDLKPANVKITPDGKVKVLDFGLAKAFETEAAGMNLSNSPTVLAENLVVLMIVEVVDRGLLASSGCVRPYNNDAEFPSCRASRPSCNAGRDHRVATSIDRAPTKSNVSATDAHSDGPLPLGLAVTTLVGLAFRPHHRQA
jgi:serine/threonine protein kinase